nr:DUF5363 family protein [Aeromonas fluvialis]
MKGVLLRWLARYDAWCEEWGLTQENRRCCTPVRYDEEQTTEHHSGRDDSLTENCGSRHR